MSKRVSREPLPGFPKPEPFATIEEAKAYASGERIQCLLCGRHRKALNRHIMIHGHNETSYKQQFGIPYGLGLTCDSTKQIMSTLTKARVDANPEIFAERIAKAQQIFRSKKHPYRPAVVPVAAQRMERIQEVIDAHPPLFGPKNKQKMSDLQKSRLRQWQKANAERSRDYFRAKNWWGWQKNPFPLIDYAKKYNAKLSTMPRLLEAAAVWNAAQGTKCSTSKRHEKGACETKCHGSQQSNLMKSAKDGDWI